MRAGAVAESLVERFAHGQERHAQRWHLHLPREGEPAREVRPLIVLLGASMGLQNAAARKIAVPDLTTTVLTLTITGLAADSSAAGGSGSHAGRRLAAIAAMLAGALVGTALVLTGHIFYPLLIALVIVVAGAVTTYQLGLPEPDWVKGTSS